MLIWILGSVVALVIVCGAAIGGIHALAVVGEELEARNESNDMWTV